MDDNRDNWRQLIDCWLLIIDELNEFLSNYFSKKLDEEIDKLWADGSLNENKIESFRQ